MESSASNERPNTMTLFNQNGQVIRIVRNPSIGEFDGTRIIDTNRKRMLLSRNYDGYAATTATIMSS